MSSRTIKPGHYAICWQVRDFHDRGVMPIQWHPVTVEAQPFFAQSDTRTVPLTFSQLKPAILAANHFNACVVTPNGTAVYWPGKDTGSPAQRPAQ